MFQNLSNLLHIWRRFDRFWNICYNVWKIIATSRRKEHSLKIRNILLLILFSTKSTQVKVSKPPPQFERNSSNHLCYCSILCQRVGVILWATGHLQSPKQMWPMWTKVSLCKYSKDTHIEKGQWWREAQPMQPCVCYGLVRGRRVDMASRPVGVISYNKIDVTLKVYGCHPFLVKVRTENWRERCQKEISFKTQFQFS